MSVCVFFLGKSRGKGPYNHTLTSSHQLFFYAFVTFSSKTSCLSAKLDTLTSKQIGVCSKNVVFLSVAKPFFDVFYGPKHIHSYTHGNSKLLLKMEKTLDKSKLVYECMCVLLVKNDTKTVWDGQKYNIFWKRTHFLEVSVSGFADRHSVFD